MKNKVTLHYNLEELTEFLNLTSLSPFSPEEIILVALQFLYEAEKKMEQGYELKLEKDNVLIPFLPQAKGVKYDN